MHHLAITTNRKPIFVEERTTQGKKMKKNDIVKNLLTLRIYDDDTLKNLKKIQKEKDFDSMNAVLNYVLKVGCETVLLGNEKDTKNEILKTAIENQKFLKNIITLENDIFVILSALQELSTEHINFIIKSLRNESITEEMFSHGGMSDTPAWVRQFEDQIRKGLKLKK